MPDESHTPSLDRIRRDALRRLGRRPMSRRKLREALLKRWRDDDAVDTVIRELEAIRAIDDRAFAQEAIRQDLDKAPAAVATLERRLIALGVDPSIAQEEAAQALDHSVPADDARSLAAAKLRSLPAHLPVRTKARRVAAVLARRGFDDEIAHQTIAELFDAHSE